MTDDRADIALHNLRLAVMLPSYDGRAFNRGALWHLGRMLPFAVLVEECGSALCLTFNNCLTRGHQLRDAGKATHALLWHDDVIPTKPDFFRTMWGEYLASGADLLCVVSPIKDERGLTSIALDGDNKFRPRRLTLREVHAEPATFTRPHILLNTGMLLFDLRAPWLTNFWFDTANDIGMTQTKDRAGHIIRQDLAARFESEDWQMSRTLRARGVHKQYATRAVEITHRGGANFPNNVVWGWERDHEFFGDDR